MRQRTLTILLVLLVVIGIVAFLSLRREGKAPQGGAAGGRLFANLPVNAIATIKILSPAGPVELRKEAEGWVVASHLDYPADFTMITDLVRKVKDLKVGRSFEAGEEVLRRRALKDPAAEGAPAAEQGTRIDLLDANGQVLARFVLGQPWSPGGTEGGSPEGQYLLVPGQPEAHIVDRHFAYLQKQSTEWLDDVVTQVPATDIRELNCRQGARTVYAFERDKPGEEFLAGSLPAGAEISKESLGELLGALSSLRFEKVYPIAQVPDAFQSGKVWELNYRLFNGLVYHVLLVQGGDGNPACLLRIEVDYQDAEGAVPAAEEGADPGGDEKTGVTTAASADEAVRLNARLSPWVYELSDWKCRAFKTDLSALLVPPGEKAGPEG